MKLQQHCNLQVNASPPSTNSTDIPLETSVRRFSAGFISGTGVLALFVAVLLLASVAMLASQMWQSSFLVDDSSAKYSVPQSGLVEKIQKQKSLQILAENINSNGVITTNDSTDAEIKSASSKHQYPITDIETVTETAAVIDKEPETQVFVGDPAIYNQTISGRVLSNKGEHVTGIKLSARLISSQFNSSKNLDSASIQHEYTVVSDSKGKFQFTKLPAGQFQLSIEANDNFGSANLQVNSGASHVDLTVNRMKQVLVEVRVFDEFSYALEQIKATVEPGMASDISDVDGRLKFQINIEEERPYRIRFEAEGYANDTLVLLPNQLQSTTENRVLLEKKLKQRLKHSDANLAGTVTGEDGTPVADARIVIKTPAGVSKFSGMTNTWGGFSFTGLPVNETYRMYIQPNQEFASSMIELTELIVGPQHLDIQLQRLALNASLTGKVVDSSGTPVPNYRIELHSKASGRAQTLHSNSKGEFHAHSLPAGKVSLRTNNQPRVVLQNIDLKSNALTQITLPIDLGNEGVTGQVVNSAGQPVPGASVTLLWGAPVTELSTIARTRHLSRTDNQGNFRFENLGQGDRYLSVSAQGYLTSNKTVSIQDTEKILKVRLDRRKT